MGSGSSRGRNHEEVDQIVSEILSAVAKLSTTVQHHDVALTRIETSLDTINDRLGSIGKTDWKLVSTGFFGTCSLLITLGVMSLNPVQRQLDSLSAAFGRHEDKLVKPDMVAEKVQNSLDKLEYLDKNINKRMDEKGDWIRSIEQRLNDFQKLSQSNDSSHRTEIDWIKHELQNAREGKR